MKNDNTEPYTIDAFLTLEKKVWDCLLSGDFETDGQLLADNFLGIYASGFSGKDNHVNALKNGPVIESYTIRDAKMTVISIDVVLIAYLAQFKDNQSPNAVSMYITSIWQNFSGIWQNIFSQDTKASESPM